MAFCSLKLSVLLFKLENRQELTNPESDVLNQILEEQNQRFKRGMYNCDWQGIIINKIKFCLLAVN